MNVPVRPTPALHKGRGMWGGEGEGREGEDGEKKGKYQALCT